MKITKEEVKYVANLARLNVSEQEADELCAQMADIISFADALGEIDTNGIEPTNHAIKIENVLREDEVKESYDREEIIKNAPMKQAGCYAVPRVVE